MPVLDVLIIKCFLNFDFIRTRVIDGILVYNNNNNNNNRLYLKRVTHLVTKLIFHEAL